MLANTIEVFNNSYKGDTKQMNERMPEYESGLRTPDEIIGNLRTQLVATNNREVRQARLDAGAVDISTSALAVALQFTRGEKDQAIYDQDFESAASWRDNEQNIKKAQNGFGLAPPQN